MNTFNTLMMALAAAFFAALSFYLSRRCYDLQKDAAVLWDQIRRYEAWIAERTAEDEERQRVAINN